MSPQTIPLNNDSIALYESCSEHVDPSSEQYCFHFQLGKCELNLPLALGRDSDWCGWWEQR